MADFLGDVFSSLPSDSLFSTIITIYVLMILYLPSFSPKFIFSPVLFSTLILLLCLLRLGAAQKSTTVKDGPGRRIDEFVIGDRKHVSQEHDASKEIGSRSCSEFDPNRDWRTFHADSFVEWDVRAPLEVIHEEYEGEEEEEGVGNDTVCQAKRESGLYAIQRHASLALFYPESDSDAASDEDFPEDGSWASCEAMRSQWEEEDRDGLIEIELGVGNKGGEAEEDNLIEIELFPVR